VNEWIIAIAALSLLTAGVLELVSLRDARAKFYPKLMALGLFMLASRLAYLLLVGDLARLNIGAWGRS